MKTEPKGTPLLVTQAQWATSLGICTRTFLRWREAGLIPAPLDLPGHPRWAVETMERTNRKMLAAGQSRYFRGARRRAKS